MRIAAALATAGLLVSATAGTAAANVGTITVTSGPTPNPVAVGGTASYNLTVVNNPAWWDFALNHGFMVTGVSGASGLSVTSSPCVSLAPNATGTLNGVVILTSASTPLGTRTITLTVTEFALTDCTTNWLFGTIDTKTRTATLVVKAAQTITFSALANKAYGDAPFTVSATASSGLPVTFGVTGHCSSVGSTVTITGVGNCSVTASQAGDGAYLPAADVTRTFAIAPAVLTVTPNHKEKTYGQVNPTFTVDFTGFVYGESYSVLGGNADVTTTATTASPVGDYSITAIPYSLSAANYTFIYASGTLTITAAPLTITADNQSRAFGASDPTFTYGVSPSVSLDTVATCTAAGVTAASPVGTYPITCSGAAKAGYSISYAPGTLTITSASLTVTADNQSRAFGASDPTFTYGVSPLVSLDSPAICMALGVTAASPVGPYPIICAGAAKAGYSISYALGTLTITSASLTVTADNQSRAFGASDPTFTYGVSPSVSLDTVAICTAAGVTAASPVGTYPITCSGAAKAGYSISYAPGTLTINPAALTVTANNQTRAFGAADPTFTYVANPSVTFTTAPVCTSTATATSPVGTYPIACTGAVAAGYTISYVDGTLTITAVPPTAAPPTPTPFESFGGATATPFESIGGATGTPVRAVTPPPTSSNGNSSDNGSLPLLLLLIAFAFGGLGLLAVQAQRREVRR